MTQQIAEFAAALRYEDLPAEVVAAARTRIVDAVGCAYGGMSAPTTAVTEAVLTRVDAEASGPEAVIGWEFGRPEPDLTAESAAFVNTTKIRYLDFNDWYPGGHPSDTIGAILAFAGSPNVSGRDVLLATVISYEVFARITRASGFRKLGFDQGLAMGVGTAAALGSLLGMDAESIGVAVGVLAASGVPTRATRSGQLSMWKGCATAYATRNAAFVTLLARAGMTGPPAAFEGRNGLQELITGEFDLEPFGPVGGWFMPRSSLKFWPVCYHLQAAAWAGAELRAKVESSDIESIRVGTYWEAWRDTGSEPDKWDPQSRETADHSLPYVLTWALERGPIDESAFEPEAFLDPTLRTAMSRVTVEIDDEVQAAFPEQPTMVVEATTTSGETISVRIACPPGHADNPLTEEQVRAKFAALASPALGGTERAEGVFQAWWEALVSTESVPMRGSAVALPA
jgi:2-methylcitrate dehydratase